MTANTNNNNTTTNTSGRNMASHGRSSNNSRRYARNRSGNNDDDDDDDDDGNGSDEDDDNNSNAMITDSPMTSPILHDNNNNSNGNGNGNKQGIAYNNQGAVGFFASAAPAPALKTQVDGGDKVGDLDMIIETHPPAEVRTRTPKEIRNFTVVAVVIGHERLINRDVSVRAEIMYAPVLPNGVAEPVPNPAILGGTVVVPMQPNGKVGPSSLLKEACSSHPCASLSLSLSLLPP